MIVWVNGAFGAGKTTTAARLTEMWKGSRRFDPEQVGYALGNNLKDIPFSDFQDLPPWRPLVVPGHDVGDTRLMGGWPPHVVWGRV